ncbi:MAG: flagellar basal body L-ring protein FlgH [Pseudobdellovibrio sp.]
MQNKILILFLAVVLQGCATFFADQKSDAELEKELTPVHVEAPATAKAPVAKAAEAPAEADEEPLTRYSSLNNMAPPSDRQYKRMTRQRMEEESALNSSAGSLWKMEGQTSYLFAENKHRREGDSTNIKLEGSALKMIESKAYVVRDLLGQLEEQKKAAEEQERRAAAEKQRLAQLEAEKKLRAERIAKGEIVVDPLDEQQANLDAQQAEIDARKPASEPAPTAANKKPAEDKIDLKEVESIPVKIVEKMGDDTYRIRGQQYLTIKKKQYKLIATGLVRAEDFNDAEVSSNKLLEAQYDLVHVKRAANE